LSEHYTWTLCDFNGKTIRESDGDTFTSDIEAEEWMDNAELIMPLDPFSACASIAESYANLYRKFKPLF
jgi:hypothetical protein